MTETKPIRVIIAKPGLDGHDQGAKVVVQALIDAGMDVRYTGLRRSPEEIVEAALDHDAQVIGLSIMTGAHLSICRQLRDLLHRHGLGNRLWIIGGNISADDHAELEAMGVARVFNTGARLDELVEFIEQRLDQGSR